MERERGGAPWTYAEIHNKVKQHKERLREQLSQSTSEATQAAVSQKTEYLIDQQITSFRGQRDLEKQQKERQEKNDRAAKEHRESG